MALQTFKIENLAALQSGVIAEAFNQALARASRDCEDRPELTNARTIALKVKLTPVQLGGALESIRAEFEIDEKAPKRQSKAFDFGVRYTAGQPNLIFNDLSEDNHKQRTIDEEDE